MFFICVLYTLFLDWIYVFVYWLVLVWKYCHLLISDIHWFQFLFLWSLSNCIYKHISLIIWVMTTNQRCHVVWDNLWFSSLPLHEYSLWIFLYQLVVNWILLFLLNLIHSLCRGGAQIMKTSISNSRSPSIVGLRCLLWRIGDEENRTSLRRSSFDDEWVIYWSSRAEKNILIDLCRINFNQERQAKNTGDIGDHGRSWGTNRYWRSWQKLRH